MTVNLRTEQHNIKMICVWGPENCEPEDDNHNYGRFKCENSQQHNTNYQKCIRKTQNEKGQLLINVCSQNKFRINITYSIPKNQQKYIFCNTTGNRSMIDYILTN